MIFPCIEADTCLSLNEKFRIDVSNSYATADEGMFTSIQIEPDTGVGFFDAIDGDYLDWQYETDGTKIVSVTFTTENGTPKTETYEIEVKAEECLLSDDECLKAFEPTLYKLLPCERCNFMFIHRKVVDCILNELSCRGIYKKATGGISVKNPIDGCKLELLTCEDLVGSEQVKRIATFWALEMIYGGNYNSTDDLYYTKFKYYRAERTKAMSAGNLLIDRDGDGELERGEGTSWNKRICLR